jgi:tripeptidyl-peptidase-1
LPHLRQLAAQAENFQIVIDGSVQPVDGTSASAPVVASVIALLNDRLLAAGRPTLGFLNRAQALCSCRPRRSTKV